MRLLLDTHVFIWSVTDSRRLKASARAYLSAAEVVYVSAASIWEIAIKFALGKRSAPPFSGTRVFDILTKQVTEAPAPLPTRRRGVPLWMEGAVTKMLAKDPENRFATTTRMVEALRRGLDTGEVMEDDVARRRESIPPPSVSRVMQRMGIQASEPVPAAPVMPVSAPIVAPPVVPASAPVASAPVMAAPVAPPSVTTPIAVVPAPVRVPAPPIVPATATDPSVTMRAPVAPPPVEHKPDSVELLRKRTGTPRVGVPVVPGAMPPELQSNRSRPNGLNLFASSTVWSMSQPPLIQSEAEIRIASGSDTGQTARTRFVVSTANRIRFSNEPP